MAVALIAFGAAQPAKRQKAPNPHWKADGCATCHTMENGKPLPITVAESDDVCLKCHDGEKASAEFHPVGRGFEGAHFKKPGWPLIEEKLACVTCHDVKRACDAKATRTLNNRMLLRDKKSPVKGQNSPFCLNCHESGAYQKINPHVMLLADKNEIIEEKCLFCHNKAMDRNALTRTGNPSMKSPQTTMCKDCHAEHKDPMQQAHIGMKLSPEILARIYVREVTGLAANLGPGLLQQAKTAGDKPVRMIPDKNGTIVCTTCHNPHQSGVFPRESVLAYRAMKLTGDGKVVSPVRGQVWCRHCHDF